MRVGLRVVDGVVAEVGPRGGDDTVLAARAAVGDTLALLQDWLADERLAGTRLVVVTRGAVATGDGEVAMRDDADATALIELRRFLGRPFTLKRVDAAGFDRLLSDLGPYLGKKGNLRFPLDRPMPFELIGRVVSALAGQYAK